MKPPTRKRKRTTRGKDLHVEEYSRWTLSERQRLLKALETYSAHQSSEIAKVVSTKSEAEVIFYMSKLKRNLKSTVAASTSLQRKYLKNIESWIQFTHQLVDDEEEKYTTMIGKLLALYGEYCFKKSDPTTGVNFKTIYDYLAGLMLGVQLPVLPPLEAALVLDLLKNVASVLAQSDIVPSKKFVLFNYEKSMYPNLAPSDDGKQILRKLLLEDIPPPGATPSSSSSQPVESVPTKFQKIYKDKLLNDGTKVTVLHIKQINTPSKQTTSNTNIQELELSKSSLVRKKLPASWINGTSNNSSRTEQETSNTSVPASAEIKRANHEGNKTLKQQNEVLQEIPSTSKTLQSGMISLERKSVPNSNSAVQDDPKVVHVPQDARALPVSQDAGALPVPQDAGALPVPQDTGALPVPQDAGALHVPQDAGALHVPQDAGALHVPQDAGALHVPQDAGALPVPQDARALPVPQDARALPILQDAGALPVQQDAGALPVQQDAGALSVSQDAGVLAVQQDAGALPVQQDAGALPVPQDAGALHELQDARVLPILPNAGDVAIQQVASTIHLQHDTSIIPVQQGSGTISVQQNVVLPVQQDAEVLPVQPNVGTILVKQNAGTIPVQQDAGVLPVKQIKSLLKSPQVLSGTCATSHDAKQEFCITTVQKGQNNPGVSKKNNVSQVIKETGLSTVANRESAQQNQDCTSVRQVTNGDNVQQVSDNRSTDQVPSQIKNLLLCEANTLLRFPSEETLVKAPSGGFVLHLPKGGTITKGQDGTNVINLSHGSTIQQGPDTASLSYRPNDSSVSKDADGGTVQKRSSLDQDPNGDPVQQGASNTKVFQVTSKGLVEQGSKGVSLLNVPKRDTVQKDVSNVKVIQFTSRRPATQESSGANAPHVSNVRIVQKVPTVSVETQCSESVRRNQKRKFSKVELGKALRPDESDYQQVKYETLDSESSDSEYELNRHTYKPSVSWLNPMGISPWLINLTKAKQKKISK